MWVVKVLLPSDGWQTPVRLKINTKEQSSQLNRYNASTHKVLWPKYSINPKLNKTEPHTFELLLFLWLISREKNALVYGRRQSSSTLPKGVKENHSTQGWTELEGLNGNAIHNYILQCKAQKWHKIHSPPWTQFSKNFLRPKLHTTSLQASDDLLNMPLYPPLQQYQTQVVQLEI